MAVNNTLSVKEYKLTGAGLTTFPITFEFTTDGSGNAENIHCQFATKDEFGKYATSVEIAQGMATDEFQIEGGNVKYIDDASNAGQNNFIVIYRNTPPSQLTDFVDNGNYSLEDIEKALDKLTFLIQERTGTPIGTYINVGVSLFFANLLQLLSKKDALHELFDWHDISSGDKPTLAGYIRSTLGAVCTSGNETIGGTKTFTLVPVINQAPTSSTHAVRKSYVDAFFPVATANIGDGQVTNAKIAASAVTAGKIANTAVQTAKLASKAVTTAKIDDDAVTIDQIKDRSITIRKMERTSSEWITLSLTHNDDDWTGSYTYDLEDKIVYSINIEPNDYRMTTTRRGDNLIVSYKGSTNTTARFRVWYIVYTDEE